MSERRIMGEIMLAISKAGTRIFRNNVGVFTTDRGTKVRTGLCNGSSDLVGWTTVTVTPDMVGQDIAVFTAIEVKSPTGRTTLAQRRFIDAVQKSGGIAGVAKSAEDALKIVS